MQHSLVLTPLRTQGGHFLAHLIRLAHLGFEEVQVLSAMVHNELTQGGIRETSPAAGWLAEEELGDISRKRAAKNRRREVTYRVMLAG